MLIYTGGICTNGCKMLTVTSQDMEMIFLFMSNNWRKLFGSWSIYTNEAAVYNLTNITKVTSFLVGTITTIRCLRRSPRLWTQDLSKCFGSELMWQVTWFTVLNRLIRKCQLQTYSDVHMQKQRTQTSADKMAETSVTERKPPTWSSEVKCSVPSGSTTRVLTISSP